MHKKFDHAKIEQKWQEEWEKSGIYNATQRDESKEKEYVLVEWPYPSGNLHIGHWFAFAVVDIYVRARRMQGKQVFFPIGFDAFGLPAENAAIKRGLDPKEWTGANIEHMKGQLKSMGNAFSWNTLTSSTDPEYFKWTQWMFTKFFEKDIAYRGTGTVNWCPSCNTVLANEQVHNDLCERCDTKVEKKEMEEWKLRITEFADALIDDLDSLDWPRHIKEAQRQWIGRSAGALLKFKVTSSKSESEIEVFTTRPDTLFGATYLVLAPEHELVSKLEDVIGNWDEVVRYIALTREQSEQDRLNAEREKTGVKLEGVSATNPANGEEIPVFIADYVLASYGTGAIMAVPAHDERDYEFAVKYDLPIQQVVVTCKDDAENPPKEGLKEVKRETVIVHLRDASTGKYALLNWHGTLEGITTAIMGGIEEGQTPEEAALTEIKEEAGLTNIKIIKRSPWITAAKYCASHKNENRCAHSYALLAETKDLQSQTKISDEEMRLHTLVWVSEAEVLNSLTPDHQKQVWDLLQRETVLTDSGYLINSGGFDGMDSEEAKTKITEKVGGKMSNTYRLRDWSIGRQRYWGTPIPIVYDPDGKPHAIPPEHLPWHLPTDVDFKPTGEPPLAKSAELRERVEKLFGKGWTPEVETMDTFVDSSWYFLRYIDNNNSESFSSREAQETWMPVDTYFGGSEHTTMHLLYSRFWQKVLHSLGLVLHAEPYVKRINRGLVLGPDGNKMSKSKGNVIDPDEQVARLGADTVRMYLAFMGPYGEVSNYPWDMGGIAGQRRYLERVCGLADHITDSEPEITTRQLHKTIKKVTEDIGSYKFNTAISALMVFLNTAEKEGLSKDSYAIFLKLLAPFAPHLAEELWHLSAFLDAQAGLSASENRQTDTPESASSIHLELWPEADPVFLKDEAVTIGVQINGKVRGSITLSPTATEEEALEVLHADPKLSERIEGNITKVIYKPAKILNLIIKNE